MPAPPLRHVPRPASRARAARIGARRGDTMRITDKLSARQTFSFEIFPPKGELPLETAYAVASEMAADRPDWILRHVLRRRLGQLGQHRSHCRLHRARPRHHRARAPHVPRLDARRRGTPTWHRSPRPASRTCSPCAGTAPPGREPIDFEHASGPDRASALLRLRPLHRRRVLPEGHVESPTEEESFRSLYLKQEAGADYLVSQLFFDNEDFYRFREKCLRHRVRLPIVAGHHAVHEREADPAHGLHLRRLHPGQGGQAARARRG